MHLFADAMLHQVRPQSTEITQFFLTPIEVATFISYHHLIDPDIFQTAESSPKPSCLVPI